MNLNDTDIDYKAEIDRHFIWFETKLPARPARFVSWLRRPSSRFVRFPLAILLIIGGILSFLPILGLWMLPLGLILIAQDIAPLQKPVAQLLGWLERKWLERQAKKPEDRSQNAQASQKHPRAK
ncbi:hypothetical protein [Rhodopseudomonas boonkerdii]|uniref:hypothetical protein n=1 Tax=Rhodopseudomonas boonkerdii TaxID=475937 RepID=UPI003D31E85A